MSDFIINFTDPLSGSFAVRPYTANGNVFPTAGGIIASTSTTANTPLILYGKGHPNYGERTDENLVHLVENFSGASAPVVDSSGNTIPGVIWHRRKLYFFLNSATWHQWNGSSWSGALTVGSGPLPASGTDGELRATGSPLVLYRYSLENDINSWVAREFESGTSLPSEPTSELVVSHNGTLGEWTVVPDINGIGTEFLKLDASNVPLTGNLEIQKTNPVLDLNGTSPEIWFRGATNWQVEGNGSVFEIRVGGTTGAGVWLELDNANNYITHGNDISASVYATNIASVNNALVNKYYLDSVLATIVGSPIGIAIDNYVQSSGSSFANSVLTLGTTAGHPDSSSFDITGFTADQIVFSGSPSTLVIGTTETTNLEQAVSELENQKASLSGASFTGDVTGNTPTVTSQFATKGYVDTSISAAAGSSVAILRHILSAGFFSGSPSSLTTLTLPFEYVAGTNRLQVFVNNVKKYKDNIGFDEALFSSSIANNTLTSSLPSYSIIGVSNSPAVLTIESASASDFSVGDNVTVSGNLGLGVTTIFTIINVITNGSDVDLVVGAPGSPNIPDISGADASGSLGLNYDFTVDWGTGSPSTVYTVSSVDFDNFGELASAMTTSFNGAGAAIIVNGRIRIESLVAPGSPASTGLAIFIPGPVSTSTSDLWGASNLTTQGFTGFLNGGLSPVIPPSIYHYYEANASSSPLGSDRAVLGTMSDTIIFNTPLSLTDVVEVLII